MIIFVLVGNTPPQLRPANSSEIRVGKKKSTYTPTEIEKIIALKQLEMFRTRAGRRKQNLQEQVQSREVLLKPKITKAAEGTNPKETKKVEPPKQTKVEKESGEVTITPVKKKIEKNNIQKQNIEDIDDVPTLTRRRITKTYSRKEPILEVHVPEDLVKIIDSENVESTSENTKENAEKQTKTKKKEVKKVVKEVKKVAVPEVILVSKRARVIKPKVIWDPDEVPNRKPVSPTKKLTTPTKKQEESKPKEQSKSKELPKAKEEPKPAEETKSEEEPKPTEESKPEEEPKPDEESKVEGEKEKSKEEKQPKVTKVLRKTKVLRIQRGGKHILIKKKGKIGQLKKAPIMVKKKMPPIKKPGQKKSELDKLLADEGTVNMLYNINQNRKNATSQKELLNRAKLLKDTITQSTIQEDNTKELRKKGKTPSPSPVKLAKRKKSRDSIRSSNQSPPPSPSVPFARRAEASRIIRRHSSSSFDSEESETEDTKEEKSLDKVKDEPMEVSENNEKKKAVPVAKRKSSSDSKSSDKTLKTDKPTLERLTSAEKRKLSTEMSKNFETPNKKTRSSSNQADVEVEVEKSKTATPKGSKKTDKLWEMVKHGQEEKRVSSRQAALALADNYKEISIKKIDNLVQIILTSTSNKIKNSMNVQVRF